MHKFTTAHTTLLSLPPYQCISPKHHGNMPEDSLEEVIQTLMAWKPTSFGSPVTSVVRAAAGFMDSVAPYNAAPGDP